MSRDSGPSEGQQGRQGGAAEEKLVCVSPNEAGHPLPADAAPAQALQRCGGQPGVGTLMMSQLSYYVIFCNRQSQLSYVTILWDIATEILRWLDIWVPGIH